jgi:hypothetical protein
MADDATNGAVDDSLAAYRSALKRYDGARLVEMLKGVGTVERAPKASVVPDRLADHLAEPRAAGAAVSALGPAARAALGLLALVEARSWPAAGLVHTLKLLGADPVAAVVPLLERGLLAARPGPDRPPVDDFARLLEGPGAAGVELIPHPSATSAARTILPQGPGPAPAGPIRQVREADGLEPILRLAALWQRVDEAPLRQTQQGVLYKRDRERLEDDPVLAGPIADALEPLPDMVRLWLELAKGVGLVAAVPGTDRLEAATAEYWADHAVHLPQMVAARWLALRGWHEQGGMQEPDAPALLALPFVRAAALLWLATLAEGEWVAVDDLAEHFERLSPGWDRATLFGTEEMAGAATNPLGSLLLGPAYQLGLVRAAEEVPSGRRVVQVTALGRYVLALGPPPPPRAAFEHFLYVQPNFEIIAYRQGLTPALVGQLSRFARWVQLGAALELRLTPESIYRGLEGGLPPEGMLERLGRHTARPMPAGVAEALKTWSDRRERVSYFAAATLIEFASADALRAALADWPANGGRPAPVALSDRLLLVEDDSAIPFHRFRLTGSRDYRRPPEVCLEVEPDGVTLALDVGRSDLFVDAELARFADELTREPPTPGAGLPRRRFRVSPASLARASVDGQTASGLARWFAQRAGTDIPPAIRLLLHAAGPGSPPLQTSRPLVLNVPTPELLDGLAQHPLTRDCLGDRLGPTAAIVPDDAIERLRRALESLGLLLEADEGGEQAR